MLSRLAHFFVTRVGPTLILLLRSSLSFTTYRVEEAELLEVEPIRAPWRDLQGRDPIFAFWHGRQLLLLCWPPPRDLTVMVSHSRDGALQAGVLGRLGFWVVRGSATRGSLTALKKMIRRLRESGAGAAVAVDGGRGPLHRVHDGVFLLAARTGRPILPLGVAVKRRTLLKNTWDRYVIPWPWSQGVCVLGTPLWVSNDRAKSGVGAVNPDDRWSAERDALDASLHALASLAEERCALSTPKRREESGACASCRDRLAGGR